MEYPITCKKMVGDTWVSSPGFPKMMSQETAMATSFPADTFVDLIGERGVRVAYKNPGATVLTLGQRPS